MKNLSSALRNKGRISRIAVLTGSGISAESGIPTFRGHNGLWMDYRIDDVATCEGFKKDPGLVWEFYEKRRLEVIKTKPNRGHYAIADLEESAVSSGRNFTLCTQNVDGLHKRAGSKNVLELHGSLFESFCTKCGKSAGLPENPLPHLPPKCQECNGMMRPNVVWFGEPLAQDIIEKAFSSMDCDLLIIVGTSLQVYPVAYLPFLALKNGAVVIEVNITATSASDYFVFIKGKAGQVMNEIADTIKGYL